MELAAASPMPASPTLASPTVRRPRVAVLGGGFCAANLATLLARKGLLDTIDLTIVDPSPRIGRGVAYDAHPVHRLNVPAGKMSMFPDDPDHFLRWARERRPETAPSDFLSRNLYGDYVEEVYGREAAPRVEHLVARADDLHRRDGGWVIALAGGGAITADLVVLATGNAPPAHPANISVGVRGDPRYVAAPWRGDALRGIGTTDTVLVVGASLTALDVLLTLREQGHTAKVTLLSRRGVLPGPHHEGPAAPVLLPEVPAGADLRTWMRVVRTAAHAAVAHGLPWQSVIDALRPVTSDIWAGLGADDRRRFLVHVRPWWDAHRHRAPSDVLRYAAQLQAAGALDVRAGTIASAVADPHGIHVRVRRRGRSFAETWRVDHVINATGPDLDLARTGGPLYRNLFVRGHVAQDPDRLGLEAEASGAAIGGFGQVTPGLFVLGGARRAQRWENNAVPDLRAQADALAALLGVDHLRRDLGDSVTPDSSAPPARRCHPRLG
ncbi:MAG: FAD/NAD(P)-binding protein [Pseudomonadota bacterium]|nr:FAD/NAD(P)-binding protein [Pseudomonadota bacterium]